MRNVTAALSPGKMRATSRPAMRSETARWMTCWPMSASARKKTIYQIGKEGDCPPPEVLLEIVQEFMDTIEERFGRHVHVLDWALHLDETSPHIHARQVFDVENRYGEVEPKQEKGVGTVGHTLAVPEQRAKQGQQPQGCF